MNRLTPFTEDILKETMNIGGAHAVNALAKMTHDRIDISVPRVSLSSIEELGDFIGVSEGVLSVILHHVVGDIAGYIAIGFSEADAKALAAHIQQKNDVSQDDQHTVLKEIGNVISGSFFSSLNTFFGLRFERSIPDAATDMTGALINSVLAEMGQRANDALATHLHFSAHKMGITGDVFLILDPDSTQNILTAANKMLPSK